MDAGLSFCMSKQASGPKPRLRSWRLHVVEPRSLTSMSFLDLIQARDPSLPYASAGVHWKWNMPGLSRRSKVCAPNRSRCAWMRLAGRRARR